MNFGLGEIFSLASAGAWAVGVILYRRLGETLPPLALNFLKNSLVLGLVLPMVPLMHGLAVPDFSALQIALALASGFIGIALADTLYFRALNELGAGRMGIIGNLYSPLVILLSFAFLGERLTAMQCAGFVLVSAGVLVIARSRAPSVDSSDVGRERPIVFEPSELADRHEEVDGRAKAIAVAAADPSENEPPGTSVDLRRSVTHTPTINLAANPETESNRMESTDSIAASHAIANPAIEVDDAAGATNPTVSTGSTIDSTIDPARPHKTRGVVIAIVAIALMAVAIVMVKRVLEAQPLMWVTALRLTGAVGGLFLIALFTGNLRRLRPQGAKFDWRVLVTAAVFGQFLAMVLWLAGYKYTQASIAAILNETSSVFIVVLAWLWLKEPLGRRGAIGVSMTLGGVALMLL